MKASQKYFFSLMFICRFDHSPLTQSITIFFYFRCPDEVYLSNIRKEDIPFIDSRWPHRYPGSVDFLTHTITMNGGLGLYLKESNQIVAWILRNQHNGIGVLQTIEEFRRRGFAGLLIKAMSKKMAKECGIDVHTCIVRENHASLKLFKTLGFQHIGNIRFVKMKPFVDL